MYLRIIGTVATCARLKKEPSTIYQVLILDPVSAVLFGRVFADGVKLRMLRRGDYPGLPTGALNTLRLFLEEAEGGYRQTPRKESH